MYKTCTIDGKALKRLYINGRLVYCTDPDQMVIANTLAMSGDFGSKVSLGTNSYVWNGSTYNYTVYDMPVAPKWAPIGAGNDNPWHISPNIVVCAAHWASSLKTGTWTGSGGLTYNVSEWTNLRTWALANGYTEEQLSGMMDIGDIAVAVCGSGSTSFTQSECPWLIASDLVKTAFWNGSLQGTIGYHVPQKSLNSAGGWSCDPSSINIYGTTYLIRAVQDNTTLALQLADESTPDTWNTAQEQTIAPTDNTVTFRAVGPNSVDVYCTKVEGTDMKLVAPVVMRSNFSWGIPKDSYIDIPERDSTTRNCASSYENTYLGYVGDSGKPTYVQIDQYQVVVGQCHSQFAGPDFCACLPVLNAYAQANNQTLNILTEEMLPS